MHIAQSIDAVDNGEEGGGRRGMNCGRGWLGVGVEMEVEGKGGMKRLRSRGFRTV